MSVTKPNLVALDKTVYAQVGENPKSWVRWRHASLGQTAWLATEEQVSPAYVSTMPNLVVLP